VTLVRSAVYKSSYLLTYLLTYLQLTLEIADEIQEDDVDFIDFVCTVQFLSVFFCDTNVR